MMVCEDRKKSPNAVSSSKRQSAGCLTPAARFDLLRQAAERLGAEVRVERLRPPKKLDFPRPQSGLIRLGDRRLIIIDRDQPLEARTAELIASLKQLDHQTAFLPPAIRRMLED